MAVVLAFRAAVILAPAGYRVVKWAEGPGVGSAADLGRPLWQRLGLSSESTASLEAAVSDATGTISSVADFSGAFELRKAQIRWGRTSGATAGTDDAVTTHHFIKLVAGAPSDAWAAADFIAAEARLLTWWTAIKSIFKVEVTYKQVRWYKAGPSVLPPQPPVRIIDPVAPGTSASASTVPPQAAISITEKTSDAGSWGRFYLPHFDATRLIGSTGRIGSGSLTILADASDTLYEGLVTDNVPAVVYSPAKAARTTSAGTTLPARSARALAVTQIQVDDLVDVIRSRRWNEALLRIQRDVAGA